MPQTTTAPGAKSVRVDTGGALCTRGLFVDARTHDAARGRVGGEVPWMQAITSPTDVMRYATIMGARAVGLEKTLGTIEAGKLANFGCAR